MMRDDVLGQEDLAELEERGIPVSEVQRQIDLFQHPPEAVRLVRPCTVGDGIRTLSEREIEAARPAYEEACRSGRLMKFVPASGAATRMFQALLSRFNQPGPIRRDDAVHQAESGNQAAQELLAVMDGLRRFAFFEDLSALMARDGLDAGSLAGLGQFREIFDYLLTPRGLDYAARPKGVLQFHRYPDVSRTPFEEHLVEAARLVRDDDRVCRLHCTVSPQHRDQFVALFARVCAAYERQHDAVFEVGFSVQSPSTDTIAVDLDNRPFRTSDGRLLLRPGGHGALIENLNNLHGDIIHVKNIDNVLPDHRRDPAIDWEKVLVGRLVEVQRVIFHHLSQLSRETVPATAIDTAARFAASELGLTMPPQLGAASEDERTAFLIRALSRPLRVCGMVRNAGDPGGGPFWVRRKDGITTLQIVEAAQVDCRSSDQLAILRSSTHFNPVDLACGVRDWQGKPFDLRRHVDPNAVFIAEKSHDGRRLKALELPGLWNGAMADWVTIFVEIPRSTFSPVKTVQDLLRADHQPPQALQR